MLQTLRKLWRIPGGLHLDYHKEASSLTPVRTLPLPPELIIPLQQHMGAKPTLTVKVGDYVYKGQALAKANGFMQVPVHASTSGTITAIAERAIAHPSGLEDTCIILRPDGKDDWGNSRLPAYTDYQQVSRELLNQRIADAGIVGLGGAVFPSAIKLAVEGAAIETLIINGAECEPYITCDDRLMQDQAADIIAGIQIMLYLVQASQCLIGIEDNKPAAIASMQMAVANSGDTRIQVVSVPTLYPTGSEKQLIKILTGKEVPSGGRPSQIGLVCHNVATARAVYKAIVQGEPLLERYVTLTGEGIHNAGNLNVLLGTPIQYLLEQTANSHVSPKRLVMGGPMMGIDLASTAIPVVKATNCILINQKPTQPPTVLPCIRCGRCADACPTSLLPQQLYWHARAREFDKVESYHLFDCIECGCCSYVCPSHIPLVNYYRFAKAEIRAQRASQNSSARARERHEFRLERIERVKREKAEKLAKHKEMAQQQAPTTPTDDPKKAAIQAALARAQAKKASMQQAAAAEATAPATTATPSENIAPQDQPV